MKNPDIQSAHERRIDQRLSQIEDELDLLDSEPATPYNRLRYIQLRLRAMVVINSWFQKDPQETIEGIHILDEEYQLRRRYEQRLAKINAIINNWSQYEGQSLDLSGVESWVE